MGRVRATGNLNSGARVRGWDILIEVVGVGVRSTTPGFQELPQGMPGWDCGRPAVSMIGEDRAIETEGRVVTIQFWQRMGDLGGGVGGRGYGVSGG